MTTEPTHTVTTSMPPTSSKSLKSLKSSTPSTRRMPGRSARIARRALTAHLSELRVA